MLQILWNKIYVWRFTIVLATIIAMVLEATLFDPGEDRDGLNALRLTTSFFVLSAVLASTEQIRHRFLVAVLVVSWLVAEWLATGEVVLIKEAVLVGIFFYIAALMTANIVRAREVHPDVISGAVAVYFCLALGWAVSYRLLDDLLPNAFSVSFEGDISAPIYFSLTTITTLGYGDILPVAPFARLWATLEAVAGLLYVSILISRLVSEFRR